MDSDTTAASSAALASAVCQECWRRIALEPGTTLIPAHPRWLTNPAVGECIGTGQPYVAYSYLGTTLVLGAQSADGTPVAGRVSVRRIEEPRVTVPAAGAAPSAQASAFAASFVREVPDGREILNPDGGRLTSATCHLPLCTGTVHIVHHLTTPINFDDSAPDIARHREFSRNHCYTWEIVCSEGHTIMHPIDHGEDSCVPFGGPCWLCAPEHSKVPWYHDDMNRLRATLGIAV